jgi:hypothetical protein
MAEKPREGSAQFHADLVDAQSALNSFVRGPVQDAAKLMDDCMKQTSSTILRELMRATQGGEISFKRLAKVALEELAKIALADILRKPNSNEKHEGASAAVASALNVNFHFGAGADANSVKQNHAQIAAQVARAAAYGKRNL